MSAVKIFLFVPSPPPRPSHLDIKMSISSCTIFVIAKFVRFFFLLLLREQWARWP